MIDNPKIAFSHPTGNANARAALTGLLDANLLSVFYTAIAAFPGSLLDRLSSIPPLAEFSRRSFDAAFHPITRTSPWIELGRILALKANLNKLASHETGLLSIDAVYRKIDHNLGNDLKKLKKKPELIVFTLTKMAHSSHSGKQNNFRCSVCMISRLDIGALQGG